MVLIRLRAYFDYTAKVGVRKKKKKKCGEFSLK